MTISINKSTIFIAVIVLIVILAFTIFIMVFSMDKNYVHSEPYVLANSKPSSVLVVYYSRSGNTELMAKEIASQFEADIHKIATAAYPHGCKGWANALFDAFIKNNPRILSAKIDMRSYRLVFLGAPVWLDYLAPPIKSFIALNDFNGKNVILFSTSNNKFNATKLQPIRELIEAKGGVVVDHAHIQRGRLFSQKTQVKLTQEIRFLLYQKGKVWKKMIQ